MEGDKQGRLGNLETMTVQQLQELLDRQEKLLSKQRFLRTLPDGGQKVKDFAAKLQQMIAQRGDLRQTSPPHPASIGQQSSDQNTQTGPQAVRSHQPTTDNDSAGLESPRAPPGNGERMDDTEALSDAIDGLVISELAAERMTDKHVDEPEDGGNLETRFPNSYENVMKKHACENKKVPFRPNRSLKIIDIHQLPDDYKHKSRLAAGGSSASSPRTDQSAESRIASCKDHAVKVKEESAVVGPEYKFKGAKEISLQQSLVLQRQQQEHLERIQTMHAAERLAERLNIKTLDYNPPALDMQYRTNAVDADGNTYDSDDDGDEDGDLPD